MNNDSNQLKKENERLKQRIKELEEEKRKANDKGEIFLNKLADYVNKGYFNKMQVMDGMFGVVKVDWDKMIEKNGKTEPFMHFIGYHPSSELDLTKIMKIPSLVGVEDPDFDTIRKVIYQAMESDRPNKNTDSLEETVPKEAFGAGFQSTTMAIRNEEGKVIGGFGIATHLDVMKELHEITADTESILESFENIMENLSKKEIIDKIKVLSHSVDELRKNNKTIKSSIYEIEEITEETNVLSINASIESSRSGSYGKGFSIISGEIRGLANKTKVSIGNITDLIEKNLEYTGRIVDINSMLYNSVLNQEKIDNNIKKSIQDINDYVIHTVNLGSKLMRQADL